MVNRVVEIIIMFLSDQSFSRAELSRRAKLDTRIHPRAQVAFPPFLQPGWVMWRCLLSQTRQRRPWAHRCQLPLNRCPAKCLSIEQSTAQASPESPDVRPALSHDPPDCPEEFEDEEVQDEPPPYFADVNLPLSPLMDPKLIAARQRHRTPKPAPCTNPSEFSKKLRNNPYGEHGLLILG